MALLLLLVLHLIPDEDGPHEVVSSLLKGLPQGSYLVVSHPASDVRPDSVAEMTRRMNQRLRGTKATVRDRARRAGSSTGLSCWNPAWSSRRSGGLIPVSQRCRR